MTIRRWRRRVPNNVRTLPASWLQRRPLPVHDQHDPGSRFTGTQFDWFVVSDRKEDGDIESLVAE